MHSLFATAPRGVAPLLADELRRLGARSIDVQPGGVAWRGQLADAYRACLWSRLANRVLLELARFPAPDPDALYAGVRELDWSEHLGPDDTLAVDATAARAPITHTRYAALKVKDAVVDQLRERHQRRPSVDLVRPTVRLNLRLKGEKAILSLDLSGESLHRRGYRGEGGAAPLKENLAAALLLSCDWPAVAAAGGALLDPMCGSGTLPIEAALMAGDVAPGLLRDYFGFLGWRGHRPEAWAELIAEAQVRRQRALQEVPPIFGFDADPRAIEAALGNAERAGVAEQVRLQVARLAELPDPPTRQGLLIANPPYGERLGEREDLAPLYAELGRALLTRFQGWQAAVFTGNPALGRELGLRPVRSEALNNGPIECELLHFDLGGPADAQAEALRGSAGARMFANRLRKNLKALQRWARREQVDCFRAYDADMPEYALAVDRYAAEDGLWLHVQEYQAPASIDPRAAQRRLREALAVLPELFEVPPGRVALKVRRRQRGRNQYEKQDQRGVFHVVHEGPARFHVNFTDYLDTGLFLDHRPTRALIRDAAAGMRFLNLFAYTGTATVHAALGGARETTSVDLSNTYLEWAQRNLRLNGFAVGRQHRLLQADVLEWLVQQPAAGYDLIFLDPPTFSSSKRMEASFDVQRDHAALLRDTARLLAPGGTLLFSTNFRRFELDGGVLSGLGVEDISAATLPQDFRRNARIHRCFRIRRPG